MTYFNQWRRGNSTGCDRTIVSKTLVTRLFVLLLCVCLLPLNHASDQAPALSLSVLGVEQLRHRDGVQYNGTMIVKFGMDPLKYGYLPTSRDYGYARWQGTLPERIPRVRMIDAPKRSYRGTAFAELQYRWTPLAGSDHITTGTTIVTTPIQPDENGEAICPVLVCLPDTPGTYNLELSFSNQEIEMALQTFGVMRGSSSDSPPLYITTEFEKMGDVIIPDRLPEERIVSEEGRPPL